MTIDCSNCFHLKRLSDGMYVFCRMNRLGKFIRLSPKEVRENGAIGLFHRKLFKSAHTCSTFVSMEDEEEIQMAS